MCVKTEECAVRTRAGIKELTDFWFLNQLKPVFSRNPRVIHKKSDRKNGKEKALKIVLIR